MLKLLNDPATILTAAETIAVPSALSALRRPSISASRLTSQNADSGGRTKGLQKATVALAWPTPPMLTYLVYASDVALIRAVAGPVSPTPPVSMICPLAVALAPNAAAAPAPNAVVSVV